jgi:hypothetical protein
MSFGVASALIGLSNSIAVSTLEEWTAEGVRLWKFINPSESCTTACSNPGLQCRSNILSRTDMVAILAYLGMVYQGLYEYQTLGNEVLMCDNDYPGSSSSSFCTKSN